LGGRCVRHHALISLRYFRLSSLYPHFFPQTERDKEIEKWKSATEIAPGFCFDFCQLGPVHTPLTPAAGGPGETSILPGVGSKEQSPSTMRKHRLENRGEKGTRSPLQAVSLLSHSCVSAQPTSHIGNLKVRELCRDAATSAWVIDGNARRSSAG
jgi:hypothetical protein